MSHEISAEGHFLTSSQGPYTLLLLYRRERMIVLWTADPIGLPFLQGRTAEALVVPIAHSRYVPSTACMMCGPVCHSGSASSTYSYGPSGTMEAA